MVNIASQAGRKGEPANSPYCASKAAVISLTECYALELAEHGITVNAICPGIVDTELLRAELRKRAPLLGLSEDEFCRQWLARVPLGRLARPEEIAALALFLCSKAAGYITGDAIFATGARHLS